MGRICIFIGILWLAAATVFGQPSSGTYAFDKTSHDFGTLKANQTGTVVFTLTNHGTAPLILLDVKVPCDCARIDWPRRPIPPGGNAALTVTYKDHDTGAFYKVVEIVTNGTPKQARLRLKGTIEK